MHGISILAIIWSAVFVASFLAFMRRLTPVLWYLFFGALLVNTGVLPEKMPEFIADFAELGIIIIMFSLGFEEDSNNFVRSIKRSWGIALFGAITPFFVVYFSTYYFWGDANMSLLCGLAMTATAVSLTMVSLKSEGLSGTPAATGIMTSAVLDDIASLVLVAILVPIAAGEASISMQSIGMIVAKTTGFFVLVSIMGSCIFPSNNAVVKRFPFLGYFSLRPVLSIGHGEYIVLALLLIAVSVGLLAHEFGFHPAVGAYMAGLIISRESFDFHAHKKVDFYQQSREIIENVAFSWIGPVFFVVLGTQLLFDYDLLVSVLPEAMLLFLGIFVGQVLSASLAARYTGNFGWPDSWMIGFGMLGRAELAFVVMNIAYVQYHIITTEVFYTLMVCTFLLNCTVPLTIRWWKHHFTHA